MKKKILVSLVVLMLVILPLSFVKASTLSDLMAQIKDLQKQVASLQSKMTALVLPPNADLTPRVMFWEGKVNQHVSSLYGDWQSDPITTFTSGATISDIEKLTYCKRWYQNTISVQDYKLETINTWKIPSSGENFTGTKMSFKCVQGEMNSLNKLVVSRNDLFVGGNNVLTAPTYYKANQKIASFRIRNFSTEYIRITNLNVTFSSANDDFPISSLSNLKTSASVDLGSPVASPSLNNNFIVDLLVPPNGSFTTVNIFSNIGAGNGKIQVGLMVNGTGVVSGNAYPILPNGTVQTPLLGQVNNIIGPNCALVTPSISIISDSTTPPAKTVTLGSSYNDVLHFKIRNNTFCPVSITSLSPNVQNTTLPSGAGNQFSFWNNLLKGVSLYDENGISIAGTLNSNSFVFTNAYVLPPATNISGLSKSFVLKTNIPAIPLVVSGATFKQGIGNIKILNNGQNITIYPSSIISSNTMTIQ